MRTLHVSQEIVPQVKSGSEHVVGMLNDATKRFKVFLLFRGNNFLGWSKSRFLGGYF